MITTQKELRKLFWRSFAEANPGKSGCKPVKGFSQNDYPTDTRLAFCELVENMQRDGVINPSLANRATL